RSSCPCGTSAGICMRGFPLGPGSHSCLWSPTSLCRWRLWTSWTRRIVVKAALGARGRIEMTTERLRREWEETVDDVTRFVLYDPDLNAWECQVCRFWWEFESGDPYEHDMRFCPRCGRRIVRRSEERRVGKECGCRW